MKSSKHYSNGTLLIVRLNVTPEKVKGIREEDILRLCEKRV
jgi:hypothetical protein